MRLYICIFYSKYVINITNHKHISLFQYYLRLELCYTGIMEELKKNFWQATGKWVLLFIVSTAVVVGAFSFKDELVHFRSLGLLGIFLANLIASATIFVPAPGIATVIAGGLLYPPLLVGLVATLGASLGDMLAFLVGASGKKIFLKKEFALYKWLVYLMKRFGAVTIFVFAFFPNPVFDAVGIISGAVGYSPYKFFLWIFLARFSRNLLLAFFGAKF